MADTETNDNCAICGKPQISCPCDVTDIALTRTALTDLQTSVLAQLRAANCDFVAEATERHWRQGEAYYIDDRVSISKRLRAAFNKANPKA